MRQRLPRSKWGHEHTTLRISGGDLYDWLRDAAALAHARPELHAEECASVVLAMLLSSEGEEPRMSPTQWARIAELSGRNL